MMKNLVSKFLLITLTFCSCYSKQNDEKFTIPFRPYTGNDFKINGYYYRYSSNFKGPLTRVLMLFNNGMILNVSGLETDDLTVIDQHINDVYVNKDISYLKKGSWGIFNINSKEIILETWHFDGGNFIVSNRVGQILNDSTFVMNQSKTSDGDIEQISETYHFREFSPKPDSTNSYIP